MGLYPSSLLSNFYMVGFAVYGSNPNKSNVVLLLTLYSELIFIEKICNKIFYISLNS